MQLAAQGLEVVGEDLAGARRGAERDALGLEAPGAGHVQPVDHLVAPAVVGAAELDHPLLAGERARRADGGHHALGPRAEHAEHLAGRHQPVDQLRQLELVLVEQPGDRAGGGDHLGDLLAQRRVVAAEDGRAAGLEEVDVLVAVDVPEVRALGLLDGQRERVVEGEVVLHAAGDELTRFVGELLAAAALRLEVARGTPAMASRLMGRSGWLTSACRRARRASTSG